MAQIIKQPDGQFAIFNHDLIVVWNATGNEVVGWFVKQARLDAQRAIESAERVSRKKLNDIAAGRPQQAYGQMAMSWEEALRSDRRHDGEAHRSFPALPPDPCPECGGEVDYRDDGSAKCQTVTCGYELAART